MPTAQQTGDFCYDHVITDDRAVAFKCSADNKKYRWLKLHPANNAAIQATNYFALTSVSEISGSRDPEKWSALTSFTWRVYQMGAGANQPTHGQADPKGSEGNIDYGASFFDGDGALVYRVSGTGVVFRSRDFEGWRAKAKAAAMGLPKAENFIFAAPSDVGVTTAIECFVGPLKGDGTKPTCEALITAQSGFPPLHPYHDGSGDHVNSAHMLDAVQQAAMLMRDRVEYPKAGEVVFKKYVELERIFSVRLVSDFKQRDKLSLIVEQGDKLCAEISFCYD